MVKKSHIKAVKLFMKDNERPKDKPQSFPRSNRLYLELIENKNKIKQDLIDKEHVQDLNVEEKIKDFNSDKENVDDSNTEKKNNDFNSDDDIKNKDNKINYDSDKGSIENYDSDREKDDKRNKYDIEDEKYKEDDRYEKEKYKEDDRDEKEKYKDDDDDEKKEYISSDNEDGITERLKELLDEEKSVQKKSKKGKYDKYNQSYSDDEHSVKSKQKSARYHSTDNEPPTLSELKNNGVYTRDKVLRNINQTESVSQDEDKKRELLFKFDLLKKSYPNSSIPEFSIHSDLNSMKNSYDDSVRRLSLDSTVESYKNYLIGGFMLTEYIFGNFIGFDMKGFTQQQIISMNSYEKLLIELGEKSYVPNGSGWSIEFRLLGMIFMNAVFFIISKLIMKSTGSNLMNMINGMNSASSTKPKKKMQGPNINLNDIPE
jgi:hypothetical protein